MKIVENGFFRFGQSSFKRKDLQIPDWICGVSTATFLLTRLVQIRDIQEGGEIFSLSQVSNKELLVLRQQLFL